MRTRLLRGSLIHLSVAICTAAVAVAGCATAKQGGDDDAPGRPDAGEGDVDGHPPPPGTPDASENDPIDGSADDPDAETGGPPDAMPPPPTDPNLIDNLDDGNDHIAVQNGRRGSWFTFHDGTVGGVQTPSDTAFTLTAGGPSGTGYHVKTTGHGFTEWGAGVGFDLNTADSATTKGKFNATAFTGISFKAKGTVPIRFSVQTTGVLETTLGGTCVPSMVAGQECDDVHGKSITLTSSWAMYQVPFSQLMQEGWGKPATFDKATLTAVQFQIAPSVTFDVSVDEVRLY